MPEPAATVFAVAAFTGLRRSELQGLRWEDYREGQIRVSRAICGGHMGDPKTGSCKGAVPVIKQLAERLEFHRAARRGLGSNSYALGVPEKVIQLILRHGVYQRPA